MRDRIMSAMEASSADYTDIRVERQWRTEVAYQGEHLQNLEASSELGGIVRCLVGGGWGIAVFNSLDEMERRVDEVQRIAKVVSGKVRERAELAPVEPVQDTVHARLEKDPRSVPLKRKQELLKGYNNLLLQYSDKIVSTNARYRDMFKEVTFANSMGSYIVEERPDVTLMLMATAREGDANIQMGFEQLGRAAGFETAEGHEDKAESAARRAVQLLQAKPVKGGVYTVLLDPLLAGVFIHEAFGHLCEADFLFKNERLQQILQPGRRFGVEELNVIEDGYLPGLRGNSKYDDEGTPRRRVCLVQNGILQGFMHSRETAARMDAQPTGNARAISYRFPPIVRMRNTYIDRGGASLEQMLEGIDYGIYACAAFGGQTELEQFTFSAAYAHEIVDGRIGQMLRDVVLTGNIFGTLRNMDMIGNDLEILGGAGGCGKGGQSPLPTTLGGPHVRIRNLTVGGRA